MLTRVELVVMLEKGCQIIESISRGISRCSEGERLYVVAVTLGTLLKMVDTGISIKEEQNGLAEPLFALSARRTLSLLQTNLLLTRASRLRPRTEISLAKAHVCR